MAAASSRRAWRAVRGAAAITRGKARAVCQTSLAPGARAGTDAALGDAGSARADRDLRSRGLCWSIGRHSERRVDREDLRQIAAPVGARDTELRFAHFYLTHSELRAQELALVDSAKHHVTAIVAQVVRPLHAQVE